MGHTTSKTIAGIYYGKTANNGGLGPKSWRENEQQKIWDRRRADKYAEIRDREEERYLEKLRKQKR